MPLPSVPPFISRHVFVIATDDVTGVSELLRITRLAQSHQALDATLLSELASLIAALPSGLPRSRPSLCSLQHHLTRLRLRHQRSLRTTLRFVLFAPRAERVSVDAAICTLRFLATPSQQGKDTLRQLADLLRLVASRCVSHDVLAKRRLDAGLFAAVTAVRNGSYGKLSSPRSLFAEFATARLLLTSQNGPRARDGEEQLPLRGGSVQLPSGGTVSVTARVEAGVCVVRVGNIGTVEVWVTRIEVAAASPTKMQVLLPPPTMAQSLLWRQPSLVARGGKLNSSGCPGEAWAAVWVR